MRKLSLTLLLLTLSFSFFGQIPQPAQLVDTTTHPIEKQQKGTFPFPEDGVYFSNDFDGARLNKIERTGAGSYVMTITPENAPINPSPWYAFQVWSTRKQEVTIRLVYPEGNRHRYSPQISKDGRKWKPLENDRIEEFEKDTAAFVPNSFGPSSFPKSISMRIDVGRKHLWVAGQELATSTTVFGWMDRLAHKKNFKVEDIGKSSEGRPVKMLEMCNLSSRFMVMVISRQHPPEITGYFAMQSFVETIADKSKLSKDFCKNWGIYVVPLMNPDGVDGGHWRHNGGGIDLNRDWAAFNQPETRAVRDFLKRREQKNGGKFYFGIDFHSTWDDIYYPMNKSYSGTMPNLMWDWLDAIKKAIPNYEPNIKPSETLEPTMVSRNYFLAAHGMEAIVFEIGDNTSRDFIRLKGKVGAQELMKLLLERQKTVGH